MYRLPVYLINHFSWSVPHVVGNSFSSTPLNSDHLPILLSFVDPLHQRDFNDSNIRTRRSFLNMRKADWAGFTRDVDSFLPQSLPTSCVKGEKVFRNAVLKASRRNTPAGYRRDFIPNLPPEAVAIRDGRDALRASDPDSPELPALERELRDVCNKATYETFNKELENTEYGSNSTKFAHLVNRLSGKKKFCPPNQPISFKSKVHTKRASIAKKFNMQFLKNNF